MRTFTLKINVNNIHKEIEKDFFKYKDVFYKALIANLCVYNTFNGLVLGSTIIEDSHYNQFLLFLMNKNATVKEVIDEIGSKNDVLLFLDTNMYVEEFISTKHDPNVINLYSLTIDDTYHIVINNKQIKRQHAQ